jgi:hypothetical protein
MRSAITACRAARTPRVAGLVVDDAARAVPAPSLGTPGQGWGGGDLERRTIIDKPDPSISTISFLASVSRSVLYHKIKPGKKCYCFPLLPPPPLRRFLLHLHPSPFTILHNPPRLLLSYSTFSCLAPAYGTSWHHLAPPAAVLSATRAAPSRLTPVPVITSMSASLPGDGNDSATLAREGGGRAGDSRKPQRLHSLKTEN